MISIKVKPLACAVRIRLLRLMPIANICIQFFTTGLTIGTITEDIHIAVIARMQVLVWIAPWVVSQSFDIAARLPIFGERLGGGLYHQGF